MKTEKLATAVLWAIVIILAVVYIWLPLGAPDLNRDVAFILTTGQRIAHGALPYIDVIDINPPTVFYMSAIPAIVSSLLGVPLAYAGLYFWWLVITASLALMVWLLIRVFPTKGVVDFLLVAGIVIISTMYIYATGDYAERDHLIIHWLICFALVRFARYEQIAVPLWAAIVTGLFAGIGLAMKPQYVILPLFTEFCFVFWNRRLLLRLREGELLAGTLMVAVLLLHPFVIPGMASSMADWMRISALGYGAYDPQSLQNIFRYLFSDRSQLLWLVLTLALGWLAVLGRKSTVFRCSSLFGILAVASFAVMLVQHKGWPYHLVPYRFCAMVGLGCLLSDAAVFLRKKYWPPLLAVALLLLLPFTMSTLDNRMMNDKLTWEQWGRFPYSDFGDIIRELSKPGEPVMFLTTSVIPAFPAITYADRASSGRVAVTFPIAFMYHGTEGYSLPPLWKDFEPRVLRMVVEDIRRERPALLFISNEKGPQGLPSDFVIRDYFQRRGLEDSLGSTYVTIGSYRDFEIRMRATNLESPGGALEKPDSLPSVQLLIRRGLLFPPGR